MVERRPNDLVMAMTEPADASSVDALVAQTRGSTAVVLLHFCESPAFSLTAAVVQKTADKYHLSQLYGGAALVGLQIDVDNPAMASIATQYAITAFPTLQVWQGGECTEVVAAELEATLVGMGVKSSEKKFDSTNFGGTATFESDLGTGKPSATAVDEIDFTGGRALGTSRSGKRGVPNSGAKSTRDFFPGLGLDEKPGDNMGKDGTPGSAPKKPRDDKPLGYE